MVALVTVRLGRRICLMASTYQLKVQKKRVRNSRKTTEPDESERLHQEPA